MKGRRPVIGVIGLVAAVACGDDGPSGLEDTDAPIIGISSPHPLTVVSGTITIVADGTDNVGIEGVQFTLDGAFLGAEDVEAPYHLSWNTLEVADGVYSLSARARDGAGNTKIAVPIEVTVMNDP